MSDQQDDDQNPDQDQDLFREAMEGVRPLRPEPRIAPPKQDKNPEQLMEQEHQELLKDMMSDDMPIDDIEAGEGIAFAHPGLQHRVLRDLRRGRYAIEAELDLHRLTRDQARAAVAAFLTESVAAGRRCVRIIHGKGHGSHNKTPVLKGLTARWLQQRDDVLACCSARPIDGGTGAVYVLLRRT